MRQYVVFENATSIVASVVRQPLTPLRHRTNGPRHTALRPQGDAWIEFYTLGVVHRYAEALCERRQETFASMSAKWLPIHNRGPAPEGMYA